MCPVGTVPWTAFRACTVVGILEQCRDFAGLAIVFDVGARDLLAAVRAVLPDLRSMRGSVLVINAALGEPITQMDQFFAHVGADGTSLEHAAKSKLTGLLAARAAPDDVYVAQLTIAGTALASRTSIQPAADARELWSMCVARASTRARLVE